MILFIEGFEKPIAFYANDSPDVQRSKWMRARAGRVTTEIIINGRHFHGHEYVHAWQIVDALELIAIEALATR